jgi:hypothetical protein
LKKGKGSHPPIIETLTKRITTSQRPSAKEIAPIWVQLPDIHPTKVLSVKDKQPDGFMFPQWE